MSNEEVMNKVYLFVTYVQLWMKDGSNIKLPSQNTNFDSTTTITCIDLTTPLGQLDYTLVSIGGQVTSKDAASLFSSLRGVVYNDIDDIPLPVGIIVEAKSPSNTFTTFTLNDGSYLFIEILPGDYEITISNLNTQTYTNPYRYATIKVILGTHFVLDIYLAELNNINIGCYVTVSSPLAQNINIYYGTHSLIEFDLCVVGQTCTINSIVPSGQDCIGNVVNGNQITVDFTGVINLGFYVDQLWNGLSTNQPNISQSITVTVKTLIPGYGTNGNGTCTFVVVERMPFKCILGSNQTFLTY